MSAIPLRKDSPPKKNDKKDDGGFKEWDPGKRWNPFNSHKLLSHVLRWREIKRGRVIPPPVLVTIDPTNVCNLNCQWCNASYIREHRHRSLSHKALDSIAEFLPKWANSHPIFKDGVEAICIAGGGEPLLNQAVGPFMDRVAHHGIQIGVVTNGVKIDDFVDPLSLSTWVGVSVDAGTKETFHQLKGLPPNSGAFDRVIENIAILVDYSRSHFTRLGLKHPAYGVSYKYLIYDKTNIGEIYEATRLAKEIGCKNIHFRPAGTTWDKIGTDEEIRFSKEDIELFKEQITLALELDDENFGVYGVTHKFNSQFERANYFKKCHAIFMTGVFMPPTDNSKDPDAYTLGLCCDRRGDEKLELVSNSSDINQVEKLWGSKKHWSMLDNIQVKEECPRCTYQPHNEIYEQVILNDAMTYTFI